MSPSDSPFGHSFPLHRISAYRSGYRRCHQQIQWGLSSFQIDYSNIPLPLRRRVLRCCFSRFFAPSMVFARLSQARLPLGPFRALRNDAAEFALCCGLPDCNDIASTLGLLLTPDGCYRATCLLLCPDFHRIVNLNLSGRTPNPQKVQFSL